MAINPREIEYRGHRVIPVDQLEVGDQILCLDPPGMARIIKIKRDSGVFIRPPNWAQLRPGTFVNVETHLIDFVFLEGPAKDKRMWDWIDPRMKARVA